MKAVVDSGILTLTIALMDGVIVQSEIVERACREGMSRSTVRTRRFPCQFPGCFPVVMRQNVQLLALTGSCAEVAGFLHQPCKEPTGSFSCDVALPNSDEFLGSSSAL
jgi:hypothetical protein